jgi:NAD(P)-dependent dehydrogenase (short-subunit alcohol dehydrogenase family)
LFCGKGLSFGGDRRRADATLAGFLYVSQLAVKQMLRQKSGSIINVSTALVDQPIAGVEAAVQIMLKGALNAVTRALAIEYAKDGIRVHHSAGSDQYSHA